MSYSYEYQPKITVQLFNTTITQNSGITNGLFIMSLTARIIRSTEVKCNFIYFSAKILKIVGNCCLFEIDTVTQWNKLPFVNPITSAISLLLRVLEGVFRNVSEV